MCGLAGCIIKNYERNADDFIRDSFVAGSLRGMDSSGIAQIDVNKRLYDVHKLPLNGSYFITDRVAGGMIGDANKAGMVTITHTRHATVGGINKNTAHPFECRLDDDGVLVGAHNGTLTNWKTKPGAKDYDVDSEWALNHILKEKYDAFEDFTGAYCFVWWDADTKDFLNIARNKERPMHVVMLESGGMAYASEAGMLYWLLERRDVKMKGPIMELEAGYWYKFPVDNPAEYTRVKLPDVAPAVVSHYTSYPSNYGKNIVQKVKELFDKVSTTPAAGGVSEVVPKSPLVSLEEYETAVTMGYLGAVVEFSPWSEYAGTFEGSAELEGAEITATVKGAESKSFSYNEIWKCRVIGVDDDGRDFGLILGPPISKHTSAVAMAH